MIQPTARRWRRAFTLLEVVLTLSLSVVLMALVGAALQFYGRDMASGELEIRQTQLAAAIMQMIEDDLRATLHTEPADMAALESLLASTASADSGGGGGEAEEDLSAAGMDMTATTASEPIETTTLDLTSGAAVLETPGLIGNQFQIQLDLSRLPRLEEYVQMIDGNAGDIEDVPSDIKTVAYYVQSPGMIGGVQDPLSQLDVDVAATAQGGLVRRSLDRAATVQAATNGNLTSLGQSGQLLAPEVIAIEFSYWDGITWQIEWSSDEYEELPMAVQVRIYMVDPVLAATATAPLTLTPGAEGTRAFSHIVRLPMAKPLEQEDETAEAGL